MRTTDTPTGALLGDRYLLTRPLGVGASASVYLAEDQSLRREVAVKVLRRGLANDDAFLRRFRAEAVAVAGLNHPHVLRVFDWGEANGDAWLVTEYLAGGSLRNLLDARSRLTVAQTVAIGMEAADGLAYAHAQGFVHRDVKPANLLFDDTGRVRVADFGVARALAEAAWTEPSDGLIGTVRYTSPEQAQGHQVDGKTDVYSLGLVLFECVTGEVPFTAETQVATLHARIGATIPFHPALGELEPLLLGATTPDPKQRLNAAELLSHLTALSRELGSSHPSANRAASTIGFVAPSAEQLTGPHRAVGARGAATTRPATVRDGDATELGPMPDATMVGASLAVAAAPVPTVAPAPPPARANAPAPAPEPHEPPAPPPGVAEARHRRRWPAVVVVLALLAAAGGALYALNPFASPTYKVPLVVGSSLDSARATLLASHGDVLIVASYGPSKVIAQNSVLKQEPPPGALVAAGARVRVILSAGPPAVKVPAIVNTTCAQAVATLTRAGFTATCPLSDAAFSASTPRGFASGVYAGNLLNPATAAYGSPLVVQLSKGPPPIPVPGVLGLPGIQAVSTLQQDGFNPVVAYEFSRLVHAGNVISTVPNAQVKLLPGRSVKVVVSKGAPATVPSLGHSSLSVAEQIIVNAGLTVIAVHGPTNAHHWTTQPPAGTEVPAGSSVTLYGS